MLDSFTYLYRNFTSQEEIDKQYNLELTVNDIKKWGEWYQTESEKARQEFNCILDIHYGPGQDETLDIFPSGKKSSPALVFIHGGYWISGSSKDYSYIARGLVSNGVSVVVVNYSLCPKVTIADITKQCRSALAYIYREADKYDIDRKQIFVAGHSAGGQLVGMLTVTDWKKEFGLPENIIKGGIAVSGIYDIKPLFYSYLQPKLFLNYSDLFRYSPFYNIPDDSFPLMISYGFDETSEFQRQSEDYFNRWTGHRLPAEAYTQEGKNHFSAIEGFNNKDSLLCNKILDFIKRNS